jgi:hypothetical protein
MNAVYVVIALLIHEHLVPKQNLTGSGPLTRLKKPLELISRLQPQGFDKDVRRMAVLVVKAHGSPTGSQ